MTELLLLITGVLIGAMNAIAGGGILLGFPVLLGAGLSPLVANATANVAVLPGLLSSAYGYRRYVRKVPNMYLILLIPCFIGAAIGAWLLLNTSPARFEDIVPWLVLFAVVLFAVQPYLHFRFLKQINKKYRGIAPIIALSFAIVPLAIYGGYFGAGFGFVMLAFLGFTKLHNMHKMNGLKNLASSVIAITSILVLAPSGLIDWRAGGIMAVGSAVGGYYGARLAQKVPSHALRIVVIILGIATVVYLFLKSV
jgi:uncharacterized membrane protein YfcA